MEKSLQPVRPSHCDEPACQARSMAGDKLRQCTASGDQEVRRDTQTAQLRVKIVRITIELVGKQALDIATAKTARRQADAMDHQEFDRTARWPGIEIRRLEPACAPHPAVAGYLISGRLGLTLARCRARGHYFRPRRCMR